MPDALTPEERDEFTRLLDPCLPDLYRLAYWLSRDPGTAEDLVQEASFRALRRFGQFERGTNFKAWVFRILNNHFLDLRRRDKRQARPTDFSEHEPADPSPPSDLPAFEIGDADALLEHVDGAIAGAVADLPDVYRSVFLFFALGELSYEEIAAALEIPVGTVMSRLFRARQRLQKQLVDYAAAHRLARPR